MQKNWVLIEDDEAVVKELMTKLNISEITAKVLYHRGITTVKEAEIFLDPENKQEFNDPFLMKDMDKAVDRIIKAIDNEEKIVIYGDYDVDGMTSSSIMFRALKRLGAAIDFYIPSRDEGYGFNVPALQKIIDSGASLLISVDCGISNVKEIEEVKGYIDFIVTDHHLPSDPINNAVAVLDPHQEGCEYPDKNLCGAGVAFKLCQALNMKINNIEYQDYLTDLDLVALATVADIVPIVGENRKIVYIGLKQMEKTENIGLQALMEAANILGKKLNTNHLGFKLGPRLNATGRLASASQGVKLLITEDEMEAKAIANFLESENEERKNIENRIIEEANNKYRELRTEHGGDMSSIVVADENWHPGVIGLAASRLLERHYLPTIVISIDGEYARGSCRSINTLHMKEALDNFKDYFTQYGGHAAAAGFTIKTEDLKKFAADFDNYVKEKLTKEENEKINEEDFIPVQNVDAFIHPSELTIQLANEIEKIEPFGVGNPRPVFACKNVNAVSPKVMGQDKNHLSFYVKGIDGNSNIRAISWNKAAFLPLIENESIDIIFLPEKNEFNGEVTVQTTVNSISPSKDIGLFPDRETMINIYKFLWQYADREQFKPYDICQYNVDFKKSKFASKNSKLNSTYTMFCAVDVFEELGLIQFDVEGKNFIMPAPSKKMKLNESRFWRLNNNLSINT